VKGDREGERAGERERGDAAAGLFLLFCLPSSSPPPPLLLLLHRYRQG